MRFSSHLNNFFYLLKIVVSHLKIHVWAGISRHGATKSWVFSDITDADLYCNILETTPFVPPLGMQVLKWINCAMEHYTSIRLSLIFHFSLVIC